MNFSIAAAPRAKRPRPANLAALARQHGLTPPWGSAIVRSQDKQEDRVPESIVPILEAMKTSHQAHLDRLLAWKAAGGKLPVYPNCETIDDYINRERLAVSRFALSIEHLKEHEHHAA
jgi:hypothetical protein